MGLELRECVTGIARGNRIPGNPSSPVDHIAFPMYVGEDNTEGRAASLLNPHERGNAELLWRKEEPCLGTGDIAALIVRPSRWVKAADF